MNDSNQTLITFEQVDSWFFRESRPHGSVGANALSSVFPPPTRSLMGCLRSHIGNQYFQKHPNKSWDDLSTLTNLKQVIGDATKLGCLKPRGVFVKTHIENIERYYLPAPVSVCRKNHETSENKTVYFSLQLTDKPYQTDLGTKRLVELPLSVEGNSDLKGAKPLEDVWLSKEAWELVLQGKLDAISQIAAAVQEQDDFISEEYRLGIQVDPNNRSVVDGKLYQTTHIRLDPNTSFVMPVIMDNKIVSMVVDDNFLNTKHLVRLGGEARMANISFEQSTLRFLPMPPANLTVKQGENKKVFMIYLLTKLLMQTDSWLPKNFTESESGWSGSINGIDLTILSACIGKAHREGGWDQLHHIPRPIQSYIPAGSAFFIQVSDSIDDHTLISKLHGQSLNENDEWGEGIMLVGQLISHDK